MLCVELIRKGLYPPLFQPATGGFVYDRVSVIDTCVDKFMSVAAKVFYFFLEGQHVKAHL